MASKDLELLEKVLFRFAVSDDAQLQNQIATLLVPVLDKLSSPDENVRKKVMEILSHINQRLKPLNCKLPWRSLQELYSQTQSSFTLNFTIVYLEMAFLREDTKEQCAVVPKLLNNIHTRPIAHQNVLLHMLLQVLDKFGTLDQNEWKMTEKDKELLLQFFTDVLLATITTETTAPGLSTQAYQRVRSRIENKDVLLQCKVKILDFLKASGTTLFEEKDIIPLLIVGTCDPHHSVVQKSEDTLKRVKLHLEEKSVVDTLYRIYQGTEGTDPRPPANAVLKAKILHYFARSVLAANNFPRTLQVIFDSIYGQDTNIRLKQAGMGFVQWVFKQSSDQQLRNTGPIILSGLLKLLQSQESLEGSETYQLKTFTYSAVGLLAKRVPSLFRNDMSILSLFFANLVKEEQRMKEAVQESLTMLCDAYANPENAEPITQLLLEYADKNDHHASYCVVYYANRLFPFKYVKARYICLVCLDDSKLEVKEEAQRGLRPYVYKDNIITPSESEPYPSFVELVNHLAVSRKAWPPTVYEELLHFVRACLDQAARNANTTVHQLLMQEESSCLQYCDLLDSALGGPASLHHVAATHLVNLLASQPSLLHKRYAAKFDWLKRFLFTGSYESRDKIAEALGLVGSQASTDVLRNSFQEWLQALPALDHQYASSVALGYAIAYLLYHSANYPLPVVDALNYFHSIITNKHAPQFVLGAAIQATGLVGKYRPLPLPEDGDANTLTKKKLVNALIEHLASSETKTVERTATALGNLCLGERNASFEKEVISGLFTLCKSTNEEIHFTVGEALSCVGGGWMSAIVRQGTFVCDNPSTHEPLKSIVKEIFTNFLAQPKYRQGAAIWLLSLVQNTGKHAVVQQYLPQIQKAFSFLLAENNEITQEVASKGLTIVYEQGNAATKEALVNNLINTLSGTQKPGEGFKLSEDTELFPKGAFGTTPDGEQLSTYKELCSLASEMGQPSLVYKFLNLASHHQLWNSRKGAAFAATAIVSQASAQLAPVLPLLVPKLFRYMHDPNPKVANAMRSIYNALVDPKQVDQYFDVIVKELMEGITSNVWRVRESSALSLADALQGRTFAQLKPYLEDLWYRIFRVLDDIKESVRLSAKKAVTVLGNITTRFCDPTYSSTTQAEEALRISLPFLLHKGLINEAEEVRSFSLTQIVKIAKVAGKMLEPHVPQITGVLLEALSSLEPAAFNYLSFHTDKMNISQEQLEEARLAIAKVTPMNDTLDICIKHVTSENSEQTVAKLIEILKTGVGLPTKVGAARLISSLAYSKPAELSPHSTKLLNALLQCLQDTSASARKGFATSIAAVAKLAPPKAIKTTLDKLSALYTSENEEARSVSATAYLSLARAIPDQLKEFQKEYLPVMLLGRFDPVENISKTFQEAWEESSIGASSSLGDIVANIGNLMDSTSWGMKRQAALSIKFLLENFGDKMSVFAGGLLKRLLSGIGGRTWKGKEALLVALGELCRVCTNEMEDPKTIVASVLKECKKNDKDYKRNALQTLGTILKAFPQDHFEEVKDVLYGIVGEDDKGTETNDKPLAFLVKANAIQALGYAFPTNATAQVNNIQPFVAFLKANFANVWNVKVEILNCVAVFLRKLPKDQEILTQQSLQDLMTILVEGVNDSKYSVIRSGAIQALSELLDHTTVAQLSPFLNELEKILQVADPSMQVQLQPIKEKLSKLGQQQPMDIA